MKKVKAVTLILILSSLMIFSGAKLRSAFQSNSYSINTSKIKNLIAHINHSKKKSINKAKVLHRKTQELSLSEPIKRKVVVEKRISKTNWSSLFDKIKIETKEVRVEIANTTSPIIKKIEEKRVQTQVDNINKEKLDRISTALSANEKSKVSEVKTGDMPEIEFYDYSKSESKKEDNSSVKARIQNYANTLQKIKKSSSLVSLIGVDKKQMAINTIINKPGANTQNKDSNKKSENLDVFEHDPKKKTYKSEYSLSVYSLDLLNMKTSDYSGFDVEFMDSQRDTISDYGNGIVDLSYQINSKMTVRRAQIYSQGHYPTVMDMVFENNSISISAPLIKRRQFNDLLKQSRIKGLGGHVLVELDTTTEDVELGSGTKYEEKIYLNRDFKVVERENSDFNYIMFLGVNPGNSLIYFRTLDNQTISKIIHVADETIYYEPNFYHEVLSDEYSIFEDKLLGKDLTALNVHAKEIKNFSSNYLTENIAFNRLSVKKALYPTGTRKYQEFKHLNESLFVGRWDQKFIDLPSEEYTRFVLSQFNEVGINNRCLIQINLTKPAKSLTYNGLADKGMSVRSLILDKDGQFYEDLSFESSKIFLLGENQGVINVKVEYTDNSVDFMQSYCSENTYLVEQL